jgi:hypothetical protein
VISFMHDLQGSDAAYRETLGCRVRFRQTRCGFELPHRLASIAAFPPLQRQMESERIIEIGQFGRGDLT